MECTEEGKKKTYSSPSLTELTPDQAVGFVRERTSLSDQEAADLLESLRREREEKQKKQPSQNKSKANHMRSA